MVTRKKKHSNKLYFTNRMYTVKRYVFSECCWYFMLNTQSEAKEINDFIKTLYIVSASVCSIKGRHIHPVRHAKHPKQIPQTKHIYNKIKRTTIWFCRGGGGSLAVYVESEYLFPIFWGRQYLFSSNFSTHRPFILRYSLFESDERRII